MWHRAITRSAKIFKFTVSAPSFFGAGDMAAQGGHEGEGTRREGVKGAEGALHGAYEMRESIGQGKFGEVVVLGCACFVSPFTPRLELNRNVWHSFISYSSLARPCIS